MEERVGGGRTENPKTNFSSLNQQAVEELRTQKSTSPYLQDLSQWKNDQVLPPEGEI